nr:hypothetical protein Iba_chr15bCG3790 [Ipomoea batatas]
MIDKSGAYRLSPFLIFRSKSTLTSMFAMNDLKFSDFCISDHLRIKPVRKLRTSQKIPPLKEGWPAAGTELVSTQSVPPNSGENRMRRQSRRLASSGFSSAYSEQKSSLQAAMVLEEK